VNDIRPKHMLASGSQKRRIDLSAVPKAEGMLITADHSEIADGLGDFVKLETGEGQDFEAMSFNHRLRRKVRRAIDAAQIRKELLVRERVRQICAEKNIEAPSEIDTETKPIHERGQRLLENGLLETAKAERVRLRIELAEFNQAARILRKQAKHIALEAGLRVYAELSGRISARRCNPDQDPAMCYGKGWHVPKAPDPKNFLRPEDVVLVK